MSDMLPFGHTVERIKTVCLKGSIFYKKIFINVKHEQVKEEEKGCPEITGQPEDHINADACQQYF